MDTYWNHNTVFHNEIVADAKKRGGRILDVGCGDGLLLERLAPFAREVVGMDSDEAAISLAQTRLNAVSNVTLIPGDFLAMPVPPEEELFSTVICVATLHHMSLESALTRMSQFLAPGGRLLIIGLAADKTIMDVVYSSLLVLPIRFMDRLHGGMRGPSVRIAEPKESLGEIRQVSRKLLLGAEISRRFYFRYSIKWTKPGEPCRERGEE